MALIIDTARDSELPAVLAMLERAGLPPDGLSDHLATTLVASDANSIVGSAALELFGLHNQWTYASATLRGVGPDAAYVVSAIRRQLRMPRLEAGRPIGLRQRIALNTGCCSRQGDAR